ncbi:MAG: ABC transporter ATP-binding protein [Gammaproteobacteria bacterium]|nr:ABC transporter ATP-binding protein [Gammaproteobacteria bacterium]
MTAVSAPGVRVHINRLAYASHTVFEEMQLQLQAGQCTCLLGRSGSGKSSLLRALAQLLGERVCELRVECSDTLPLTGRVAYMAQEDLLLPWLTVLENATLGYRLRDRSHTRQEVVQRATQLLRDVGLAAFAHASPAELSGGMRQRAALARTLMENQPVVLMDEPFSALDAITRLELQNLAAGMLRRRTTLLITHDPLEALRLGDAVYTLDGQPAKLSAPLRPCGPAPRPAGDAQLLSLQAQLLTQLADSP